MKNRKNKGLEAASTPTIPSLALATQADAFSRIGLFVGGRGTGASEMVRIGNYQLTTLRQIKSILEEANR